MTIFFPQMKAMLAYLEAARYKVQSVLNEINEKPKPSHPLAKHIEVVRDKGGMPMSILKVRNHDESFVFMTLKWI